jgi:predicted patatin/cPLA2 family phospholipase
MKALVVSGGGSKGSFAGGIIEFLKEGGSDWELYAGTSTGALIIPMVALNQISDLKRAYTSITPEKIFKLNPFFIKSINNGEIKFGINHFSIAKNLIFNKSKSLGDSSNLRKTLEEFLNEDSYNTLRDSDKEVIISVTNLTTESVEFKSIHSETYSDFLDWMWASGSATPFMSIVEKNGYDYVDGGVLRFIPLIEAIQSGATEIDAIILMQEYEDSKIEKVRNVLHLMSKMIKLFLVSRKREDSDLDKLHKSINDDREIKLNLYYTPRKMTNNPYIFDTETMKSWWNEGYDLAKNGPNRQYILTKRKVIKIK